MNWKHQKVAVLQSNRHKKAKSFYPIKLSQSVWLFIFCYKDFLNARWVCLHIFSFSNVFELSSTLKIYMPLGTTSLAVNQFRGGQGLKSAYILSQSHTKNVRNR